jgi:hypothetical protein
MNCGHISNTLEPCYDISLPILPPSSKISILPPPPVTFRVRVSLDLLADAVDVKLNLCPDDPRPIDEVLAQSGRIMSPLGRNCALMDCLAGFCCPDVLLGDNAYDCAKCRLHNGVSSKMYRIEKAPPVLVLHLKRFVQQGHKLSKIDKQVRLHISLIESL